MSLEDIEAVAKDASALDQKRKKWQGTVDAGASLRSGYTDTLDANTGVTVIRKGPKDTLTLELTGGYGEVDSEVNTRRLRGSAKYQYYAQKRLYVYGQTAAEHDPGRKLDLRYEVGGGLGYDVIKKPRRALSLDFGLDYAVEHWNTFTLREYEDAKEGLRNSTLSGWRPS